MPGELLALIGPNGAGKSTCFNMLNGQLRPDGGSISFAGRPITGLPPRVVWRLGVGRTFQITATFLSMTVLQNVQTALLSFHGRLRSFRPWSSRLYLDEAFALLELVGMADQGDRLCSVLAYGDLKRVELAIALANAPKLLLMDEPTAGMAPGERIELMRLASEIAHERRIGILFTEHDMDVVFAHAARVMVLDRGRLIAVGTPRQVRTDAQVRAVPGLVMNLEVHKLDAFYGRAQILFGVKLKVAAGEALALLGRNGAGKSTTLRAILGLGGLRRGRVVLDGRDISGMATGRIVRRGLGWVPEDRRIFTNLTIEENLEIGRQPPRAAVPHWTPERLFALFPNLAELRHRRGRSAAASSRC
ncbi:MAG: ATP-binding cassette domain-containing protein [Rhodospirillales bacterium]